MGLAVAIVGRPNVGKSTLFNRLCGKRAAIVDAIPGVTRDRREGEAALADLRFRAIDTAGLEDAPPDTLEAAMRDQTARAVADAGVVLFLIDARAGVTPLDRHFADWLRPARDKVIVIANKCEGRDGEAGAVEAYELGLGEPVAISAEHGEGMVELYEALRDRVGQAEANEAAAGGPETAPERPVALAILGRPNVGKSTLVNRLLGEERMLTGPEPGVTRDAIAVEWRWQGTAVRLVDTAGIRRRPRVTGVLEKAAVADALRAIRFAEVAVLVIDATQPLERQDLSLARQVVDEGRALVIAANKWDLVTDRQKARRLIAERLEESLPQARGVAVVALSALGGDGVERLMPAVVAAHAVWNRRLPTGPLNRFLDQLVARHAPPASGGRAVRVRYITQVKARPPSFALFVNRAGALPESWVRYLVNALREEFDLPGVPIRILTRVGTNPFATKTRSD
jgi:GTP-binding protein